MFLSAPGTDFKSPQSKLLEGTYESNERKSYGQIQEWGNYKVGT